MKKCRYHELSNSTNCLIIKFIKFIEFIEVIEVIEVIKVAIKIWATNVWATKVGVNYISSFLHVIVVVEVANRGNFTKTYL